jgi:hypothetical protein
MICTSTFDHADLPQVVLNDVTAPTTTEGQ